jgi:hypothetical protein
MRVIPGMMDIAAREREKLWEAAAAMDRERRRRVLNALRYEFHAGQAERLRRTMTELVEKHERAAEKLLLEARRGKDERMNENYEERKSA